MKNILFSKTMGRFTVTARIEPDLCPDLSYLGEFSNKEGKYSISHEPNNSKTFNYFNAANVETLEQAQQNYDEMMKLENGNASVDGIIVDISLNGYVIGSASVWGYFNTWTKESDKYMTSEARNIAIEAICMARETLKIAA